MFIIMRETSTSGLSKCFFEMPDVRWGTNQRGRPATKIAPKGEPVSRMFVSWDTSKLQPKLEDGIKHARRPFDLREIGHLIYCERCKRLKDCQYGRNPMGFRMKEFTGLWEDERESLRRAVILLAALGPTKRGFGGRPGGYLRKEIEKIAGTEGTSTDRVIDDLMRIGILGLRSTPGWPRYEYRSKPRSRYLVDARNESARRQVRDLLTSVRGIAKRRRFEMDKDYDPILLTPGTGFILVGEQPPRWFKEIFKEFWFAFRDVWYDSVRPRLSSEGNPCTRQPNMRGVRSRLTRVLTKIDAISQPQVSEWRQFRNRCRRTETISDLMKTGSARKYRGSFVLFSVSDLEP